MATTIEVKNVGKFTESLTKVAAASAKKAGEVLAGVYVRAVENRLTMMGTDGTTSIRTVDEDITFSKTEITFVVPGRLFTDIMKKMPKEEISLKVHKNKVEVHHKKSSSYGMNTVDVSDFPISTYDELENGFTLPGKLLANAFKMVIPCASNKETRPILTGVHMFSEGGNTITLVATDSFKLAYKEMKLEEDLEAFKNVVIPNGAAKDIVKILDGVEEDARVSFSDNQFRISAGTTSFSTRLLEGNYPDTSALRPKKYEAECVIHREEVIKTLDRVKVALSDKDRQALFTLKGSEGMPTLTVNCKTEVTNANEEIFVNDAKNDMETCLNVLFFHEVLQSMESKEIRLQFSGKNSPLIVNPSELNDQFAMLVPIRS
jgi:DNA polymerase-3 subunit beta